MKVRQLLSPVVAAGLAFVAVAWVSGVILIVVWRRQPASNTPEFEVMKVCLQVLGIVVVGAVIGFASSVVQQDRLQ